MVFIFGYYTFPGKGKQDVFYEGKWLDAQHISEASEFGSHLQRKYKK